jgi:hypothetical protein
VPVERLGDFGPVVGKEPGPDAAWRLRTARTVLKLLAVAPATGSTASR